MPPSTAHIRLVQGESDDGTHSDRFVHGPRWVHTRQDGGNWTYPMADGLGSVRGWANSAGTVSGVVNYSPYGVPDATVDEIGFTGEQTDGTDQVYLRARYYDPGLGVFPSHDPWEGTAVRPMNLNVS